MRSTSIFDSITIIKIRILFLANRKASVQLKEPPIIVNFAIIIFLQRNIFTTLDYNFFFLRQEVCDVVFF